MRDYTIARRLELGIEQTKPIADFNERFTKVEAGIIQALGGPDGRAAEALLRYRRFATDHEVAEWLIIDALEFGLALMTGILGAMAIYAVITALDDIIKGDTLSESLLRAAGSASTELVPTGQIVDTLIK
jgi:hypothetical protein